MKNSEDNKFKISVVMPVYNTEKYLEEAIDSVVNQTIGFKKNIQLILVDDGSTDSSGDICRRYLSEHPDNIIYVKKENGGVSNARNEGLRHVSGEYVNFMDSDDRWDLKAFEAMYEYLAKDREAIDVATGRHCFFGRVEGFKHPLDYKFKGEGIVDIDKKHSHIQIAVNSSFIKTAVARKYSFDSAVKYFEDGLYITRIILEKKKYGIVPHAVYYYRKRAEQDSAIDKATTRSNYFKEAPQIVYKELVKLSQERCGEVIPYIQYIIMYDLQWRIKQQADVLSEDEREKYKERIKSVLTHIDHKTILKQRNMDYDYKLYALMLKEEDEDNIAEGISIRKNKICYNKTPFINLKNSKLIEIIDLEIKDNRLHLYGISKLDTLPKKYEFTITDDKGESYEIKQDRALKKDRYAFDGTRVNSAKSFSVGIPLEGVKKVFFRIEGSEGKRHRINPSYGKFAKLRKLRNAYYTDGGYIATRSDGRINIFESTCLKILKFEAKFFLRTLLPKREFEIALLRALAIFKRMFKKRDLWILSDRTHVAGDNGEALFRYLNKIDHDKKVYFALSKSSENYRGIKGIGKVLNMDSFWYKLNFLAADKIISSHADGWTINAFGEKRKFVSDLYKFDFVFLQHGITKDDISSWLYRDKQNIKLFVTSASAEYNSILLGDYGYSREKVALTGLPRYDRLENEARKKIVFLPTWRKSLAKKALKGSSVRPYSNTFTESEYYRFYNSLINDEEILETLKRCGYEAEFYPHPALGAQRIDFKGNSQVKVATKNANYRELFKECALLVTDYSSVAFDFAYLKKPLVYSQFDKDSLYDNHIYDETYHDYESEGFGPVCRDYDSTVQAIVRYIEGDCKMEEKYRKRVDEFFAYTDKSNCERVYKKILEMDEGASEE